jgi:glycosyltransferase involved in cell wall biosynthesis
LGNDIEVLTLNRRSRFDAAAIRRFNRWVTLRGVDLIHIHGRSSLLFHFVSSLTRGPRTKALFHDHYGKIDIDKSVPIWLRLSARSVDRYVGVSEDLAAWAIDSGLDQKIVSHVTNYLNLGRLVSRSNQDMRPELRLPKDVILAVVVCGLRPEKGVDILLRAMSAINNPNLKVVVVGGEAAPGYMEACKRLADQLGVSDNVIFVGQKIDIREYLPTFDFAIVPSISESGPLVLIEYLVSGLPVIATRTGQISAEVEAAGVGSFADPGDIEGMAAAITDVAQLSGDERAAIGRRGAVFAKENFDLRKKIDEWLNIYSEVLSAQ